VRRVLSILAVLIGAAVLWGGGELHYGSCVDAAEVRQPVSPAPPVADENPFGDPGLNEVFGDSARRARDNYERERRARRAAVEGCSRLPW
jgi:hypothetical protein